MKVTQADSQFIIRTSTFAQRFVGILFVLVGAGIFAISLKATPSNSSGNPIWLKLFGILFFILGIVVFVLAKSETTTLSKSGPSEVSQKGLFGSKKSQQFNASDVTSIINMTSIGNPVMATNTNYGPQRRSTLMLQFKDGSTLVLAHSSKSANGFSVNGLPIGAMIQRSPYNKLAEQLGTFLGVPVQQGPDNPAAMITEAVEGIVQSVKPTTFNPGQPLPSQVAPTTPSPVSQPGSPAAPQPSPNEIITPTSQTNQQQ